MIRGCEQTLTAVLTCCRWCRGRATQASISCERCNARVPASVVCLRLVSVWPPILDFPTCSCPLGLYPACYLIVHSLCHALAKVLIFPPPDRCHWYPCFLFFIGFHILQSGIRVGLSIFVPVAALVGRSNLLVCGVVLLRFLASRRPKAIQCFVRPRCSLT